MSEKIETTTHRPKAYKIEFAPTNFICGSEIPEPIKNKVVTSNCRAMAEIGSYKNPPCGKILAMMIATIKNTINNGIFTPETFVFLLKK